MVEIASIEMFYDRVLVKQDPPKEEIGSIQIAESFRDAHKQHLGTVMAVGNGRLRPIDWTVVPLITKVGDRVAFGMHAGSLMPEDVFGPHVRVLREDEIILRMTAPE